MITRLTIDEMKRVSPEQYRNLLKPDISVVLDNVRSLMNIGSVFRTVDAFGFKKIWLCGITGTPPHREIHKTALGATESVEWEYHPETGLLLQQLSSKGAQIVAVEQAHESVSLDSWKVPENSPLVLVFGNEINGVSDDALAYCNVAIEIPQFGSKHSFNVAVTAGIVLWEISRQKKFDR